MILALQVVQKLLLHLRLVFQKAKTKQNNAVKLYGQIEKMRSYLPTPHFSAKPFHL